MSRVCASVRIYICTVCMYAFTDLWGSTGHPGIIVFPPMRPCRCRRIREEHFCQANEVRKHKCAQAHTMVEVVMLLYSWVSRRCEPHGVSVCC